MTSLCLEGGPLIVCPPCNCICHPSMSYVASRRYLTSLLSRSRTPHVKECVALAAARTACPRERMRLVRSLWESPFSCASHAFLFRSYVLCHAFLASTHVASWAAWRAQTFRNALLVFVVAAFLCGPTVGEFLGSVGHAFAGAILVVLETVLVLLGPFDLISRLCDYHKQGVSLLVHRHDLFHGGLEGSVHLRQNV